MAIGNSFFVMLDALDLQVDCCDSSTKQINAVTILFIVTLNLKTILTIIINFIVKFTILYNVN